MNGTWIHPNLKTIEIQKKSNTDFKYTFKVNRRNTRRKCDMFKVNNNNSRAMTSFCSGVDRVI